MPVNVSDSHYSSLCLISVIIILLRVLVKRKLLFFDSVSNDTYIESVERKFTHGRCFPSAMCSILIGLRKAVPSA